MHLFSIKFSLIFIINVFDGQIILPNLSTLTPVSTDGLCSRCFYKLLLSGSVMTVCTDINIFWYFHFCEKKNFDISSSSILSTMQCCVSIKIQLTLTKVIIQKNPRSKNNSLTIKILSTN